MKREELINSTEYKISSKAIGYWYEHKDKIEPDNSQICGAFEDGAEWAIASGLTGDDTARKKNEEIKGLIECSCREFRNVLDTMIDDEALKDHLVKNHEFLLVNYMDNRTWDAVILGYQKYEEYEEWISKKK